MGNSHQVTQQWGEANGPVKRRPAWLRLLLKFLLAGAVTVISAEGVLRMYVALRGWTPNCYAAQLQLFRPHAKVGYDLQPGFRLRSGVYQMSINSLGLRGPEISRQKPPDARRIAIVGESSAFGYSVSDGQEAARLLEKVLRERGQAVEVVNGGVPGYNLFQSLVRYQEVLGPLKPDLVIVYLGWNDLPYVVSDEPDAERFRRRSVAPAWERLLSHSTLYGFVVYRLWGGPVRMSPADFAEGAPTAAGQRGFLKNLTALTEEIERSGAEMVICAQATAARPDVSAELRAALGPDAAAQENAIRLGGWLHKTLRDFAAERHLIFIDAYEAIPPDGTMLADYVHLTAEGERRLAALWADSFHDD